MELCFLVVSVEAFEVCGLLEWWPVEEIEDLLVKLVVQVEAG